MSAKGISHFIPRVIGTLVILHGVGNLLLGALPLFNVNNSEIDEITSIATIANIQSASELVSIFIGVILVALGLGLFRRKRGAWFWAMVMQVIVFVNSCMPQFSLPTLIMSVIYTALLLAFRREFYIRNTQGNTIDLAIAWLSVIFALGYGIVGSYILREQFSNMHTMLDSIYFTFVTYSTVGYGDITPITPNAKMFTVSMIVVGITSFVATLSVIIGPIIQQRVKGVYRIMNKFNSFTNHVVICGYNELTRISAQQLVQKGAVVLFLEKSSKVADEIKAAGFNVVTGDATDPEEIKGSRIAQADVLICGHQDDARNILTMMAAEDVKEANSEHKLKIICRIEEAQNIDKAKRLGACEVISPAKLGGDLIAEAAG